MPHLIHLHSALSLTDAGEPPEWVHVLPAGTYSGVDGRGPYTTDVAAVLANSKLPVPIDEMHATDLAGPKGGAAPARGWIVELQDRQADGIWARVEWTPEGHELVKGRAYRGLSPVMGLKPKSDRVVELMRAALTNVPNLDLKPILQSQGNPMDMMEFLRQLLGLEPDADDATVRSTLQAMVGDRTMQSQAMAGVRKALGLPDATAPAALLPALQSRLGEVSELEQLRTRVTEMETAARRATAEAAVDRHITAGRGALSGVREQYVALHMQNPTAAEEMMSAMPNLNAGGLPANPGGDPATRPLTKADENIIALMGLDPDAYRKQLARGTGPVEIVTAGRTDLGGEE